MESSVNQSTARKKRESPSSRDDYHRNAKRHKKQQLEAQLETLTPKLQSEQTFKHKKLKRKKKRKDSNSRDVYGKRRWTVSHKNLSIYKDRFVVVTYNVLGVDNARKHPHLYSHVPWKFMDWNYRKETICNEIRCYHPSLICFQEVDRFKELNAILQKDGFEGIYKGRTGEACDGCAIFWKHDLFTLIHKEDIEFRRFGLRDNVAQLCVLKMNETQGHSDVPTDLSGAPCARSVVVGNIHVLFNPKRGDVKLGQVRMLIEKARQLSKARGNIPIILSGDLNSLAKSAMYQYLSTSELDIRLHDRRHISGQADMSSQCESGQSAEYNRNRKPVPQPLHYHWSSEEVNFATGCEGVTHLAHNLNLSSAYAGIPGTLKTRDESGEPSATSYHSQFMGTVDYIWHTEDLVPLKILETLSISDLTEIGRGGLPSREWGSDHLALVCEFAFLDKKGEV